MIKTATILVLHWGGFVGGSPALMEPHVDALKQTGAKVVNVAYPLGNPRRSERYVERVARRYHNAVAYGTSAGGTLALDLAHRGLVRAAVAVSPVTNLSTWGGEMAWSASSRRRATPGCPKVRTLLIHAEDDDVVPFSDSLRFAERCKRVRFVAERRGGHGIIVGPLRNSLRFVARFDRVLGGGIVAR